MRPPINIGCRILHPEHETMSGIIQCVPNFSEGRNRAVVESIVDAAKNASTADIIDYSSDSDHNRSVVTFLGTPDAIADAVFAAAECAVEKIDLTLHDGAHPRVGAIDVIPLVPIADISMEECVELSYRIGNGIGGKLKLPVYYYEESALLSHRAKLADIRRGGFEGLCSCGISGDRAPDAGPQEIHPTAGVVVVGARGPLIAYNINLLTTDLEAARIIVGRIRSGEAGFTGVKSMAVWLASRSMVQVSMNITCPNITGIGDVFRYVSEEAQALGIEVAESEIIGAVRKHQLEGTSPEELKSVGFKDSQVIDNWIKYPC